MTPHTNNPITIPYFVGNISHDAAAGTLRVQNQYISREAPVTYVAPFDAADLDAALADGTAYVEVRPHTAPGQDTIRIKRPPLPGSNETNDQLLATTIVLWSV